MPRNGSGSFNLVAGNPVVTNTTISSTWANNTLSDIAGALTQSLSKDGQTTPTNNIQMGGFKLTNLAAGTSPGQSVRYEQLFSQGVPSDIASASTVDIGAEYSTFLNVTGNTTITSFGTNYNGPRFLTFKASLTVTHDATTLACPGNSNIITQSGDVAILTPKSTTSGTPDGWKVSCYLRSNNVILNNDTQTIASASTINFTAGQYQLYSITGTTNVTAVTMYEAQPVFAIAAGAFKLVNSANLILPGGSDYTCSVNDLLMFIKDGSGAVYVFGIQKVFNSTNDPTFVSTSSTGAASPNWVNGKINATSLGIAQTYQDVGASRAASTTYTNSTGKPIYLSITFNGSGGASLATLTINGISDVAKAFPSSAGTPSFTLQAIIPNGGTYNLSLTSATISKWMELRT